MWLLPALLIITAVVLSVPLSAYFAWLMDGKYKAPRILRWFENRSSTPGRRTGSNIRSRC